MSPTPLLNVIRFLLLALLLGAAPEESLRDLRRTGDNGQRLIRRNVRLCGGLRTRSSWIGFHDNAVAVDADRAAFIAVVERRMAGL